MIIDLHNRRETGHFRTRPGVGPQLRTGDVVSWRNPATAQHWGGLRVEFVYPRQGTVLLRGWFGRLSWRDGGEHAESKVVRIEQVTLEQPGPEAA